MKLRTAPTRHAGSLRRSHLRCSELVQCAAWAHPVGSRPDSWRDELLYRVGDTERHPGPKTRASLARSGRLGAKTFRPPLRNVMTWPFQSSKIFVCQRHSWARRARQSRSQRIGSSSGTLGLGQAGTLIWVLRRLVLLAKTCGADLKDHQSVFRTLWRVHRSWSLAIAAEFRTPVSHEIVLSVAVSASSQNFLF